MASNNTSHREAFQQCDLIFTIQLKMIYYCCCQLPGNAVKTIGMETSNNLYTC